MSSMAEIAPRPAAVVARPVSTLRRQLPNALTIFRVVLATAFFVLLSFWQGLSAARKGGAGVPIDPTLVGTAIIFIVAALTDALDGHLSRKWSVVSTFGRIMDPFADKVLVVGAFLFLAGPDFHLVSQAGKGFQASGVFPWMVVVIIAREMLVTSIRGLMEGRGKNFQANGWGKVKMIVQAVAVPSILGMVAVFDVSPYTPGRWLVDGLVWITVLVTAISGVPYIVRGFEAFREEGLNA